MTLYANLVDIFQRTIYPAEVIIEGQRIVSIKKTKQKCSTYILPGFIDAHIHIESSMLPPSRFAPLSVSHGTIATVSDPHEIANVLGVEGVMFMIKDAKRSGMKFFFGASPCVPATPFETSGAHLDSDAIEHLLQQEDIYYLSEVMNFPGVINNDDDMMKKISLAKKYNKPIDGHAPGLVGDPLKTYIGAGISTDHEAFELNEALEKLNNGMKIQIREGSAAKNYEALHPLIEKHYNNLMFCSDDKHPNDLAQGHINRLVKRSLHYGYDLFKVLQIASINPILHYNLPVGMLRVGDLADFIEVKDCIEFEVVRSFVNGLVVYENNQYLPQQHPIQPLNNFHTTQKKEDDFALHVKCKTYKVIDAINTQLITKKLTQPLRIENDRVMPDLTNDILIIAVINRYEEKPPALSFVHGFGLTCGAIASSVAHDSHNIIAVGCDTQSIALAVNTIIQSKGGICALKDQNEILHLPLEIAGLMSTQDGFEVAKQYEALDRFVKEQLNSPLDAPFMTLSFMALLVIPELKLSDKGLFETENFHFVKECDQ